MTAFLGRPAAPHLGSDLGAAQPAGPSTSGRLTGWLIRAGLWLTAVGIVVVPVGAALRLLDTADDLPDQPRTPVAHVTGTERAQWEQVGRRLPANAPPVVLSYHDIRPGSTDGYVVSPELFERQLMALAAAGYRTVTSQEYADYLGGAPAGQRSVYLTFDDGTEGLYLYADRILARQRMHGASYVISGRVGEHRPYYLTWPEVRTMTDSGRWDFQAHTHDLHTRGEVGADRADGSLLTGRAWTQGAPETDAQHRARVQADTDAQLHDFRTHGLPRPLLFAYPFSDLGSHQDRGTVEETASIIDGTYAAAFTNEASTAAPTSRRSSVGGEIQRIEVFGDTKPEALLAQVAAWTAIEPGGHEPLKDPDRWWDSWSRTVPDIGVFSGAGAKRSASRYVQATYAPFGSADWIGYRVDAEVAGLDPNGNNANIAVRVGGAGGITVRTAYGGVQIVAQSTGAVLASPKLDRADRHRVRIDVTSSATVVTVDGRQIGRLPTAGGPRATGGIGLSLRHDTDASLPHFTRLTVSTPGRPAR